MAQVQRPPIFRKHSIKYWLLGAASLAGTFVLSIAESWVSETALPTVGRWLSVAFSTPLATSLLYCASILGLLYISLRPRSLWLDPRNWFILRLSDKAHRIIESTDWDGKIMVWTTPTGTFVVVNDGHPDRFGTDGDKPLRRDLSRQALIDELVERGLWHRDSKSDYTESYAPSGRGIRALEILARNERQALDSVERRLTAAELAALHFIFSRQDQHHWIAFDRSSGTLIGETRSVSKNGEAVSEAGKFLSYMRSKVDPQMTVESLAELIDGIPAFYMDRMHSGKFRYAFRVTWFGWRAIRAEHIINQLEEGA